MMPPTAMQPEDMHPDAQDAPEAGAGVGIDGSYEICLKVMPNDQFSVYKESGGQEQVAPSLMRHVIRYRASRPR